MEVESDPVETRLLAGIYGTGRRRGLEDEDVDNSNVDSNCITTTAISVGPRCAFFCVDARIYGKGERGLLRAASTEGPITQRTSTQDGGYATGGTKPDRHEGVDEDDKGCWRSWVSKRLASNQDETQGEVQGGRNMAGRRLMQGAHLLASLVCYRMFSLFQIFRLGQTCRQADVRV